MPCPGKCSFSGLMHTFEMPNPSPSFYNESMTKGLWDCLALLIEQVQESPTHEHHHGATSVPKKEPAASDSSKKEGTPKCLHCYSGTVHKSLKINPSRTICPFLELSQRVWPTKRMEVPFWNAAKRRCNRSSREMKLCVCCCIIRL
jgi:hypothetical protein